MTAEYWKDRPVLVTGAGGFIASHLVEALLSAGARVRAFVRYNSRGDPGFLSPQYLDAPPSPALQVIPGDLRDLPALIAAADGVSHIFHLGALIAIPYSYLHPAEVVETNVLGALNVLLAARGSPALERLVHTSTSEVYGTALRVPIDEDHPLQGQSPYSASKIGADKLVEAFHRSFGLPAVTVRPFNTYGPRQSARAVVPAIISQALTCPEIRLGNLDARRDLTYVADTVGGFLRAGALPGLEGETLNLGSGSEVTIADLAGRILRLVGRPLQIVVDPARLRPGKSEVERLLSDNSRARSRLGWSPQVPLDRGLALTIDWIKAHLHLYTPGSYQL
jgi:NAD dependent epimerase/dehydratase